MSQHKRNTQSAHEAIRKKSDLKKQKVLDVVDQLKASNEPINYNNVANLAGVSKSWLYRHDELSVLIEELRESQNNNHPRPSSANNESKNAVIDTLKKRIKKLEAENKELKKQLEVVYGELHLSEN